MKVWQIVISGAVLVLLVGCKSLGLGGKRVDYSAGAEQTAALEIPPDLTSPASDERYRIPQGEGVATYSDYNKGGTSVAQGRGGDAATGTSEQMGTVYLREIDGNRIIVMNDAFDRSWRRVGLAIEGAGLAVEDRDRVRGIYFLRPPKAESGWLDKLQFWKDSANTNMRYRVNVKDGGVVSEVSVTDQDGASDNASRQLVDAIYKNINPGGAATMPASVSAINATGAPGTASLQEIFDGSKVVVVNDGFDRSWQKVGAAIERAGLVVESNDRNKGVYLLRPDKAESGLLDKLQFWKDSENTNVRYRVNVKDGGKACEVSVTDQDGASDDATGRMIEAIYKNIGQ